MTTTFLQRDRSNVLRVKDLMGVLHRANPEALVFVREDGFLVMPSVREVIASMVGPGSHREDPTGDDLPSVLIE